MSEEKLSSQPTNEFLEILTGLREWHRQHPQATMAEIERETMQRMAKLQARMIEELSQELPTDRKEAVSETCPTCGNLMQRRGQRTRKLRGPGEQDIQLKREFWVCPVCGTGIFPPG